MNALPLEIFTDTTALYHKDFFQEQNVLALLGKRLEEKLFSLLKQGGVTEKPRLDGRVSPHAIIEGEVWVAEGAVIEPFAMITGPCYIGPGSEVRHGAYMRGNVYVGKDCVVGHTTEVKGSVFLDGAKAGHFAYVGDSILGRNVNLGAGTKLANLKLRGDEVRLVLPQKLGGARIGTGLRKFGAVLGDECQTGCNAVLSPGTLLLPGTGVMSCFHYQGTLERGIAR